MQADFTGKEIELIYALAESLTGSCQKAGMRKEILVANVSRRMHEVGASELDDYLMIVDDDEAEFARLVSALTIHTTSWFRERPHFDILRELATDFAAKRPGELFRVWCAACSTGEEVYSFATVLEDVRVSHDSFNYELLGSDVDAVSVRKARAAIYDASGAREFTGPARAHLRLGSGPAQGRMTISKGIRQRCRFEVRNLTRAEDLAHAAPFHFVVCRNVLIYFDAAHVEGIVRGLLGAMEKTSGHLCLGHSEAITAQKFGLELTRNCVYRPAGRQAKGDGKDAPKTVLVVDDSMTIRSLASRVLKGAGYAVLTANDALEATAILKEHTVDAITLDVNMPGQNGLDWLAERRRKGMHTPVIVLSDANPEAAAAILNSMQGGAQEFVEKSQISNDPQALSGLVDALASPRAVAAGRAPKQGYLEKRTHERPDVIVIGASTGGTEALTHLLRDFPRGAPPVVVVQHISPSFAEAFADRLAKTAGLKRGAFANGTPLSPGHLYMATGDQHIEIDGRAGSLYVRVSDAPPVSRHRPSIDTLFLSTVAARASALGILLTGMGRDGARGLQALHKKGFLTCAQDEASSVVYGMPKEAVALGGVSFVGNLDEIRRVCEEALRAPPGKKTAA